MKVQKNNDIRTPRQLILMGRGTKLNNNQRAIVVKYKDKIDIITLDEFASALYKKKVKCHIEFLE